MARKDDKDSNVAPLETIDLTKVGGGTQGASAKPTPKQVAQIMRTLNTSLTDLTSHHRDSGVSGVTHLAPFVATSRRY